jgi:GTPase SAR1 family protein
MLVFDVTDDAALSNLDEYWLPKILENADPNVELAVVGNKTDLLN